MATSEQARSPDIVKALHCLLTVLVGCVSMVPVRVSGFYAQPEAVRFSHSPSDVVSCEGCGTVELTCGIPRQRTVANLPDPELSWLINRTMVSSGTKHSNDTHIWSVMTLSHPSSADSGLYQCAATDGSDGSYCGNNKRPCVTTVTLSNEARVQILAAGGTELTERVSLSSCASELLRCGSLSSIGCAGCQLHQYQLYWTKNGRTVHSTQGASVLPDGSLVLGSHGDSIELAGSYQCMVTFANKTGQSINLTVASYNVTLDHGRADVTVEIISYKAAYFEHEPISLVCAYTLSSVTCPTISWSYNGDPLDANTTTLTLRAPTPEQSGNYCCSVSPAIGQTHEACVTINIYPALDSSSPDISTIFIGSDIVIFTALPVSYPLAWYHNGVLLENDTESLLTLQGGGMEEVYGVYQCFLYLQDRPLVHHKTVRVMPPDRVNPPSMPQLTEIIRAVTNSFDIVPFLVTWEAPFYTGGQDSLHFRLEDRYIRQYQWSTTSTSQEILINQASSYGFHVTVLDSNNSTISDRSRILTGRASGCHQYRVFYPPSLALSCYDGRVQLMLQNDPANNGIRVFGSRFYYIRGFCESTNSVIVINETLSKETFQLSHFFPFGTNCSMSAAASSESLDSCLEGFAPKSCYCVDPNYIEFTSPVNCHVIGTVNVSIAQDAYEVSEQKGTVQTCLTTQTLDNSARSSVVVHLLTVPGSAKAGRDFEPMSTNLTLLLNITGCVNMTIFDDTVLEDLEEFTLVLNAADPSIHIPNSRIPIRITDDDSITVSLRGSDSVTEGSFSASVCVEIEGEVERTFNVSIDTESETAIERVDFAGLHKQLSLNMTSSVCKYLELYNDSVLENAEVFTIKLSSIDPNILIPNERLEVTIEDDDYVTVSLSGPSSISESNGSAELCIEFVGTAERNATVTIDTISGTAEEDDFVGVHSDLTLYLTGSNCTCIQVKIIGDLILENDEIFSINLNSSDPGVMVSQGTLQLTIVDDDCVNISLALGQHFNVTEGSLSASVCVEIEREVGRSFNVSIDTESGTAKEGIDFTGVHKELSLTGGWCESVDIRDDAISENTESFSVILSSADPHVNIQKERLEISIEDDDFVGVAFLNDSALTLPLNATTVTLCVSIEGELNRTVAVTLATNKSDSGHVLSELVFHPSLTIVCVDLTLNNTEEQLPLMLLTSDPRILLRGGGMTVFILSRQMPTGPTENSVLAAVAGSVSGLVAFAVILATVFCVAAGVYVRCKYRNMTVAERENKKKHIKSKDTLQPDTEDWLQGIELVGLDKITEEDAKSEHETYFIPGSVADIPELEHSPPPSHTKLTLASNQLEDLEQQTEAFLEESRHFNDTSGNSSDTYITLPGTHRDQMSPMTTDNPTDTPT